MGADNTFGETNFNPKMSSEPLEEKPFLTEEDCDKAYEISPCTEAKDYYSGFLAAARKANEKISSLESELKTLREERDELQSWKESEMAIWEPVLEFCQDEKNNLGIPLGASISKWILKHLKAYTLNTEKN